jgi:pyridoxamine 5'-phosphate oxidase
MEAPLAQFNLWLKDAANHPAITEPTAMTLSTAQDNRPSARVVLLKECTEEGFVFYTNFNSRKSTELKSNPYAALNFFWMPLGRQVRVEGKVIPGSDAEADAYFASRPRERQIGAWASHQSRTLESREELEQAVDALERKYEGQPIPRPPHWSGWRLKPSSIEFWQASEARLHERHLYKKALSGEWIHSLLYP